MSEFIANIQNGAPDPSGASNPPNPPGVAAPSGAKQQPVPPLPDELGRWRTAAYGDARDDLRAALSAGADTTDDLTVLEFALDAIVEENAAPDPEARQRALHAATRLLRERTALLAHVFDYLWTRAQAEERS